jgi:O-methyltransferase
MKFGELINKGLGYAGFELRRIGVDVAALDSRSIPEIPKEIWGIMDAIEAHELTMVSRRRLIATALSVIYAVKNEMPGAFVECGVWRGGNSILASSIFDFFGAKNHVFLFDTFDGMTSPTVQDTSPFLGSASKVQAAIEESGDKWCAATQAEVQDSFQRLGVGMDRCIFVEGDVLNTLSEAGNLPVSVSVLRLDTDYYESTKVELEILWPRLLPRGILLLDDYGFWDGQRKAVDEFFDSRGIFPMLSFVDEAGRLLVKN